jgi:hypothetical protein
VTGPEIPASADPLAALRTGSWLDEQCFPPLRYAVPGIIPEGSTLLVGAPKIGKSWLVLSCALAKAIGGRALGSIPVHASPVLYLALEDGDRRMQSRCRTLLQGDPIPAGFEYMTHVEPGRVIETIGVWLARNRGAAAVVILDTLGKVMPPALPGESAYQRDYRIGSALKRLVDAEPGASLLVNHHDRKAASDDFIDSVSGTHGLAGAADTTVVLVRARNESDGLLQVTGRDIAEGQYAVRFTNGSAWQLDGADLDTAAKAARTRAAAAGLGDRSAEIVSFVAARPAGVGPTETALALGIEPKHAGTYLTRLAKAGRIVKAERGKYRPNTPVESVESVETTTLPFHTSTLSTPLQGELAPCGHPLAATNSNNGRCGICIAEALAESTDDQGDDA